MSETLITGALCTLAEAKNYVQRSGTIVDDDRLAEFVNDVTAQAELFTTRRLLSRTYASFVVDGSDCNELWAPEYPVTAVTAIRRRIEGGTTMTLDITNLRLVDKGRVIWLERDYFNCGRGNIELDFTAGYLTGTHDADLHALRQIARRWLQVMFLDQQNPAGRGVSVTAGGATITNTDVEIPNDVMKMLQRYVRIP